MTHSQSHKARVLRALLAGETLDDNMSFARFGFRCVVQYCSYLVKDGWKVQSRWVTGRRGRWKEYWIAPEDRWKDSLPESVRIINQIAPYKPRPPEAEPARRLL
jgi:hypothetical protein